jgi:hypothetical protein
MPKITLREKSGNPKIILKEKNLPKMTLKKMIEKKRPVVRKKFA